MQLSDHTLRHLPFFEEVASLEESSDAWLAATAGLVTLRLVDAWLEDGSTVSADDGWNLRSVSAAIEKVSERTPVRMLLVRIVDALREQKPDIHVVVTPLMAYGRSLEFDAKWLLAADVYSSVLAHLHPTEDSDASIAANLRLGGCYRNLDRMDPALAAYDAASRIGQATGDMVGILRGRLGEASVAWIRGNLPKAASLLDETLGQAQGAALRDVRSRALQDRSTVAILSGHYELGVGLAYQALRESQVASERDKILNNIAGAFVHLGVYSAARDAYLVLSATAEEQYMRWVATLNLLDVSSLTGAEVLFEQFRRQMADVVLPPRLATGFQLMLGTGFQRFGKTDVARTHLERAIELARQHGFNQDLFEAEEALAGLKTPAPPYRTSAEVSLDLEEVAQAINEMRRSFVGA